RRGRGTPPVRAPRPARWVRVRLPAGRRLSLGRGGRGARRDRHRRTRDPPGRGGPRLMPLAVAALCVVALLVGLALGRALLAAPLPQTEQEKQRLIEAANAEADSLKRQAALDARELAQKARADVDASLKQRQAELERRAAELGAQERTLEKRERG